MTVKSPATAEEYEFWLRFTAMCSDLQYEILKYYRRKPPPPPDRRPSVINVCYGCTDRFEGFPDQRYCDEYCAKHTDRCQHFSNGEIIWGFNKCYCHPFP
jgi:hypothetical protein